MLDDHEYHKDITKALDRYNDTGRFLKRIKKQKKRLDDHFHKHHAEVFEQVDCLSCANCCKTTSPIFYQSDISRLAKALKMSESDFIASYLQMDEDGDMVLKSSPCPFLGYNNECIIYNHRPKACREYPHTDRKNVYQILKLTHKNTVICPAVARIVDRLQHIL
ncbi:MAG: YkgJ family cysteine cluster protein [Cyclobacteriaceae bacterium]|nr:YkgJ family cysteine cluster protein [Cyclobacteriaceae bacterium]